MFSKINRGLVNLKNKFIEFVEITKVSLSVSKALNSKYIKYQAAQEFVSQTADSLNIILLGVLINYLSSGNKEGATIALIGIFSISIISEILYSFITYKLEFLGAFRDIDATKFLVKVISKIPVKYRSTAEFKEIEKSANINVVYGFFYGYIRLIVKVYSTILTFTALTFIQPTILFFALFIGIISLYFQSKSRMVSFNSRHERNFYRRMQTIYIENYKVTSVEDLADNIKINNNSRFLDKIYDDYIGKYKIWFTNFVKSTVSKRIIASNLVSVSTAASLATVYGYGIAGVIPIGNLVIYSQAYSNLISTMGTISLNIASIFEDFLGVKALDDLINFKVPETVYTQINNLNHIEIEFQNVSFAYPGTTKKVLKNISFKISNKDKLGIIGENGAGKSTLIKLLFRIFTPTSGQILINGTNLNDIEDKDYYELFSILGQKSIPEQALSVEEIIYLGDTSKPINKKKILESAKLSTFHKDVLKLEDGYKQLILAGENVNVFNKYSEKKYTSLSGGQYRKLLLSKIFYGQKPIIVLDEPTDSIDPNSAYTIFKNLNALKHNQITLFITHDVQRMQLVANKVLVLKDGEIVEYDTTEKLIKKKDSYLNKALKTYMETIR
jgi:ABC-type multidrug transport system fused ATPase/permease subunit